MLFSILDISKVKFSILLQSWKKNISRLFNVLAKFPLFQVKLSYNLDHYFGTFQLFNTGPICLK